MDDKEQQIIMAEIIVKLSAIERILVKNNVIDKDELITEIKTISDEVTKYIQDATNQDLINKGGN